MNGHPGGRSPARARLLAATMLTLGVAACAGPVPAPADPVPSDPVPADPVALTVDVEQPRVAQARGLMHVRLVNDGDPPLEVTSLQLVDARFARVAATPKSTTVSVGGTPVTTPIEYGDAVCDGQVDGPGAVAVTVDVAGVARELTAPVGPDGEEMLARLHTSVCRQRAVADAATLRFGDDWAATAPATARGHVELTRGASDATVVLEQAEGTVILTLRVLDGDDETPVLTLPAGTDRAEVAVEVSAARCDPHALIESKKTYSFPVWIRVDDEPVVPAVLEPDGPAREALEALLAAGCGLDG